MRIVIQRVDRCALSVDDKPISKIEKGLLVLLGIGEHDTEEQTKFYAQKIPKLRIFRDSEGKMNKSVLDENGQVLLVSNFTLYGDTHRTNRPSFCHAGEPTHAKQLYELMANELNKFVPTQTGVFGAHMHLDMLADGPVTLIIDTDKQNNIE